MMAVTTVVMQTMTPARSLCRVNLWDGAKVATMNGMPAMMTAPLFSIDGFRHCNRRNAVVFTRISFMQMNESS